MNRIFQIDPSLPIVFETDASIKDDQLGKLAQLWRDLFDLPVMVVRDNGTGLMVAGAKPADRPPVMSDTNHADKFFYDKLKKIACDSNDF